MEDINDYFAQVSLDNNNILLSVGGGEYDCQMNIVLDRDDTIDLINDLQKAVNANNTKITLTRELIDAGATYPAGFNSMQVALFGLKYPLKHGWIRSLIGKEIDAELYQKFISLKGMTKKRRKQLIYKDIIMHQTELGSQEYAEFVRKTM